MDNEEPTLLMATFCALHDVKPEPVSRVEQVSIELGKAKQSISLDESRAQVHLSSKEGGTKQRWFLDSRASNHMTGDRGAFAKLDGGVVGFMKFGKGSTVDIRGHGTIIFRC